MKGGTGRAAKRPGHSLRSIPRPFPGALPASGAALRAEPAEIRYTREAPGKRSLVDWLPDELRRNESQGVASSRREIVPLETPEGKVQIDIMNGTERTVIHEALSSVQDTVTGMTFPRCDQEDLLELIERVEEQLHSAHPNTGLMCTFLNSIARSLRAQPEAREACLLIEQAIETAGVPSTWQSGI